MKLTIPLILAIAFTGCTKAEPPDPPGLGVIKACNCNGDCGCNEANSSDGSVCECAKHGKCSPACDCYTEPAPKPKLKSVTLHYVCPRCRRNYTKTWEDGVPKPLDCKACSRPGAYIRVRQVADTKKSASVQRRITACRT